MLQKDFSINRKKILQDYNNAALTLLWCIDRTQTPSRRKLVFASIELYPKECPLPATTAEQRIQINNKSISKPSLYFRCITMSAKNALDIYFASFNKHSFVMSWESERNKDGSIKIIETTPLFFLPTWPHFALAKRKDTVLCPFLPEKWGACRMSHLLTNATDPLLKQLVEHEVPVNWIKERLLWNINDYPELIGSIHLIMPNPLFRYMEQRLIPATGDTNENVRVHLAMREGQVINKRQTLITLERSHFGVYNTKFTKVVSDYLMIDLAGRAEQFASVFYCPQRGLLDYTDFGSFIRSIHVDIGFMDAVRIVHIPGTDKTVSVSEVRHSETITIGEEEETDIPEIELGKNIGYHVRKHQAANNAILMGQKLFAAKTGNDAKNFIRDLFRKAKQRIIIVDPYFSTIDFFEYICTLTSHKINITILTSSLVLKEKSSFTESLNSSLKETLHCNITLKKSYNRVRMKKRQYIILGRTRHLLTCKKHHAEAQTGYADILRKSQSLKRKDTRPEKGEELLRQIKAYGSTISSDDIVVSVMTGDQPLFHDRFLVIDNNIWFSGNSLNHLGERASMMIQLPNPSEALCMIDKVLNDKERVRPLEEWVAKRKEEQKKNKQNSITRR